MSEAAHVSVAALREQAVGNGSSTPRWRWPPVNVPMKTARHPPFLVFEAMFEGLHVPM